MFLPDTNVIAELRAGKPMVSENVRRWAASVPATQQYLSVVTLLELELGVLKMERKDARQGQVLRSWLQALKHEFSSRLLPFGVQTAVYCATMHVPNRRPERDAMIAATSREHAYTLVTRNTQDFRDCGVELLNPWLTALA